MKKVYIFYINFIIFILVLGPLGRAEIFFKPPLYFLVGLKDSGDLSLTWKSVSSDVADIS